MLPMKAETQKYRELQFQAAMSAGDQTSAHCMSSQYPSPLSHLSSLRGQRENAKSYNQMLNSASGKLNSSRH